MRDSPAFVHFLYEPGDGGLDRVAIYLANGMAERGLPTELWLTRNDGPLADLISSKVEIRIVPSPNFGSRGLRLFLQIPALAKMIRKHRPRAIFSAGNQSNLNIAIARKLAGDGATKIIQKITNPIVRPGRRGKFQWFREWRFEKTAAMGDKTFVLSRAAADEYATRYPELADKFVMAHLACVTPEMEQIGRNKTSKKIGRTPQFLAAGRLAEQKDYPTMIAALALIKHRAWQLTIIGNGPKREFLEKLVADAELTDRIVFAGFVFDPAPFFAEADYLLLSSRWEGLGAVAIEAMATGCGVVATDCCTGLSEIIRQTGRQPTPVGDHLSFAHAIETVLDNPVARDVMRRLATPYSIQNAIHEHLDLLRSVELEK